ncbi:pimeloyl-ACP methyl ester esterase BioH [Thiohalocapsa marina]|uniref:Pimeloyl-[acyl-carrier protein] methyl ester esterase n=1 Tax=Thiohalocapsa marina TaxID=424902 RepID=A0A5M8FVE4_9GAMM|nr:pimeloyl-ACP methyl ester esterase BioH [Thiohalocapsa marina]KAA6187780.1 pimeloyl-ACP methyl ester esterase BioH [Thiohalocapsa marina]
MTTATTNLVLLPGWGMNSAVWAALEQPPLDAFARRLSLHPIDLPGHGGQAWDAERTRLSDWADAALQQAPEQAIWLGWSLGGLVALQAARQAPKRVQALILMTATPRFVQARDWRVAMAPETLARFNAGLLEDAAATLHQFLALQVRGSDAARPTLRALRAELAQRPAPRPEALATGLTLLAEEDLRGPLPDIAAPALWLFGERDTLVPAAVAERVGLLMPGARTRVIAGAAHAPFLSHGAEVAAELQAFLDEVCP